MVEIINIKLGKLFNYLFIVRKEWEIIVIIIGNLNE